MNNEMLSQVEVLAASIAAQEKKVHLKFVKLMVLAVLAGMFIALGAAGSSVAMHAIPNVGVSRTVGACIFPVGLMLIVFLGGELFTGDCLLILGLYERKCKLLAVIRVLVLVWIGNLLGAVLIAALVYFSGQFGYSADLLGAFTIKVAYGKATMNFGFALSSGILCNIFVCGAVLMATAAKSAAGKVWSIFFPIFAFVVSGFEHCVANMYYIPAGLMALNNDAYKAKAMEVYGYTNEQLSSLNVKSFFVNSSIPVTIGNIIGGMLFVGTLLYIVHHKKESKQA